MQDIVIHPLVTLSIVDHHQRVCAHRAVGVVLGNIIEGEVHLTSAYALVFEEEQNSFFIDTSYLKTMYSLHHKVNSAEEIMGWYHTGGVIQNNDNEISQFMQKHTDNVHCLIISEDNDPIKIYKYENEKMVAINYRIEAEEAEEVGVEHLIRDIKDENNDILEGLRSYKNSVDLVVEYLSDVDRSYNSEIMEEIQECLNNMPEVCVGEMKDAYFANLIKSVVRLKDLIKNRKENRAREGIVG